MTATADLAARIARARETVAKAKEGMMLPAELVLRDLDGPQIVGQRVNNYALSDCDGVPSIDEDVAPLIVLAVNALPALLDVAEAAGEMRRCCVDTRAMSCADFDHAVAALDAALAKLKGVLP